MTRRLAAFVALLALAACSSSDARLKKLSAGISRDSVLTAMGGVQPHRVDSYLVGGHSIETLYFAQEDETDTTRMADRMMSPTVLLDGKLAAWGWVQWDSIAVANKIQVAKPQP